MDQKPEEPQKFAVTNPLRCPKCWQTGSVTWLEQDQPFRPSIRQLVAISPGFREEADPEEATLRIVLCDRCGTAVDSEVIGA